MIQPNNDLLVELIKVLEKMNPDTLNACIMLHFDKETKQLKSISPMLNVSSIEELYGQLSSAEKAIHNFLQELVDKGLHDKDQLN